MHLLTTVHEVDGIKMTLDISEKSQYASLLFPKAPLRAKFAENNRRPTVMSSKNGDLCPLHITVDVEFDPRLLAFCKIVIDGGDISMATDDNGYCVAMNINASFVVTDTRPEIADLFQTEAPKMKNPHTQVYRSDRPCVDWKGAFSLAELMLECKKATILPPRFTNCNDRVKYDNALHTREQKLRAEQFTRETAEYAVYSKLSVSSARNSITAIRHAITAANEAVARAKCVAAVMSAQASANAALEASGRAANAALAVRHLVPATRNQKRNQRRRRK